MRKFLRICILSGISGSVSIALWIYLVFFVVGGLMEGALLGALQGFLFGLPLLGILVLLGLLVGIPIGGIVGFFVGAIDLFVASWLPISPRVKFVLASAISAVLSFGIYYQWLKSQGPLFEMN